MSKMESIKAIVNNMKEMTKEELQQVLGTISEEELDETLTKAEVARQVVESLKAMDEESVAETFEKMKKKSDDDEDEDEVKEEIDEDEDEDEDDKEVKESASVEASLVEIEIDDDLSAISEALDLSEENAEKAKTIFTAAVKSKVAELKEGLESQYSQEFKNLSRYS